MKITSLFSQPKSNLSIRAISAFIATSIGITLGCGSGRQMPVKPALSGSTNVTMLLSATANDQLSQFNIGFNSLTLTTKSGKTVTLFNTAQYAEFIHLNGSAEPLLTLSVPQNIYTAATANIGPASFSCATLIPSTGGLNTSTWAYGYTPSAQVSINLPEPITVTGNAMGLSLNLLVSQSASFPSTCYLSGNNQFSITPTFNLAPVAFSTPVKELLLDGQISSVDTSNNSFALALADGPSLSVNTDNSTVYQGMSGFSLLTAGTFVDMDAVIQADGSQLATRVAVQDTNTTNLSVSTGPVLQTNTVWPVLTGFEREHQGYLTTSEQAPASPVLQLRECRFPNVRPVHQPAESSI